MWVEKRCRVKLCRSADSNRPQYQIDLQLLDVRNPPTADCHNITMLVTTMMVMNISVLV
jgi:hypothetical protein